MIEAEQERAIAESPEAQSLQERIIEAVLAYGDFLTEKGVVWDDAQEPPRLKAQSLDVTVNFGDGGSISIALRDGAVDRVYGNGSNPDPFGAGPSNIPHKLREVR